MTPRVHFPRFRFTTLTGGFALVALTACGGPPPSPGVDPVGIWTGALVTDQGTCPTERDSTLQINAHDISFAPADGAQVLKGMRGPDNLHFQAERKTLDANRKPQTMVFNGYPVGQAIGGIYGTSACRAHITLTRPKS